MDTETRKCILDEALSWRGTPFHHKGRIKGVGVDCGGFLYCVYSQFFSLAPFPLDYPEDWSLHKDDNEIYLNWISPYVREVKRPEVADIVLFKFGRAFSHGTMYIGNDKYLHAYGRTTQGCVQISHKSFFKQRAFKCFMMQENK